MKGGQPPWLQPFDDWFDATDPRPAGRLDLARLDAFAAARGLCLADGRPLRFIDARDAHLDARDAHVVPYEVSIARTGRVPTRVDGAGMLHDWLNALCWLRWPAIKAGLNRLQAEAIGASADRTRGGDDGTGTGTGTNLCSRSNSDSVANSGRGRLRDLVTLFDESGVFLVSDDATLLDCWRRFDWNGLFVAGRRDFGRRVQVLIVGHALLEKLLRPYKSICAQALAVVPADAPAAAFQAASGIAGSPLVVDPGGPRTCGSRDFVLQRGLDELDSKLAPALAVALRSAAESGSTGSSTAGPSVAGAAQKVQRLAPLPLLGIPGWWPANEDPAFYNDPRVFRTVRTARSRR